MDNRIQNQQTPTTSATGLISQSQIPAGEIKERHLVATPEIANGDLLYGDGNNNFVRLPLGTNNQVLTVTGGVPTWGAQAAALTWTAYTPTITGVTSPSGMAQYAQLGNLCFVNWENIGGTSTLVSFTVTLPITPAIVVQTGGFDYYLCGVQDNSTIQNTVGVIGIQANVQAASLGKTYGTISANAFAGFTASGTKTVSAQFFYPLA